MGKIRQSIDIHLANHACVPPQQKGPTTTARYRNEAIDEGETSDTA